MGMLPSSVYICVLCTIVVVVRMAMAPTLGRLCRGSSLPFFFFSPFMSFFFFFTVWVVMYCNYTMQQQHKKKKRVQETLHFSWRLSCHLSFTHKLKPMHFFFFLCWRINMSLVHSNKEKVWSTKKRRYVCAERFNWNVNHLSKVPLFVCSTTSNTCR